MPRTCTRLIAVLRRLSTGAIALAVLTLFACGGPAGVTSDVPSQRVAVIDIERVVRETDRGREALEKIDEATQRAVEAANELRRALETAANDLQAMENDGSTEEEKTEARQRFEQLRMQAARQSNDQQAALARLREELLRPVQEEIEDVARRLGEEGWDLILDRRAAAYRDPSVDLTDEVIHRMAGGDAPERGGDDEGEGDAASGRSRDEGAGIGGDRYDAAGDEAPTDDGARDDGARDVVGAGRHGRRAPAAGQDAATTAGSSDRDTGDDEQR